MKKQSRDRVAAIKAGVMRHIVGEQRVAARRAAKVAAPAETAKPAAVAVEAPRRAGMKISASAMSAARTMRKPKPTPRSEDQAARIFQPYQPPPGVIPANVSSDIKIAMDEAVATANQLSAWGGLAPQGMDTLFAEGIGFLGYAYLAELTQRPEFRRISERIATEMTRKWIKLQVTSQDDDETPIAKNKKPEPPVAPGMEDEETSTPEDVQRKVNVTAEGGDADNESSPDDVKHSVEQKKKNEKAKKLQELEDELTRLHVKQCFYNMAEWDGWFGRSHIFVDLGVDTTQNNNELASTIGTGRNSKGKVRKGSLKRFTCVEPMWCYPAFYNANNPLDAGFYNPQHWYVNGIQVHKTRLLTFVGREVPDILKPAYAFGGLSMSQMAKPYVDNWLRTRQAVCDLIESFAVSGVYTNMSGTLQDGGDEAIKRIELFNITRSNAGAFMLDKDTEEYFNVSTPLGTLDALQAQSQEQMSSITGIPLVVLLGITPTGLNASSEGEMRAFYDWINAYQEKFFRDKLQTVIELVQLSLWGKIDKEISFIFEPLWSMTEKELAEVEKIEAETDQIRIDSGVIHPEEARIALANEPNSRYADINVADVPEPPADPMGEQDPFGNGGGDDDGGDSNPGGDKPDGAQDGAPKGVDSCTTDHPNTDDGKRGSGSLRSSSSSKVPPAAKSPGVFNDLARDALATAANSGTPVVLPGEDDEEDEDETRILFADDKEPNEIADGVFAFDEFDESKVKRDGDGQFATTGSGGSGGEGEGSSKSAEPSFKTKRQHIAHLLTKGVTPKDLMSAMGWPSVSMPAQAKNLGMKLDVKVVDGKKVYYGTPLTDEEKATQKQSDREKAEAKKDTPKKEEPAPPAAEKEEAAAPAAESKMDFDTYRKSLIDMVRQKDATGIKDLVEKNPEATAEFRKVGGARANRALDSILAGTEQKPAAAAAAPATEGGTPSWASLGDASPDLQQYRQRVQGELVAYGKEHKKEELVGYDLKTGKPLEMTLSSKNEAHHVAFSPELMKAMEDPANSLELHHNHPSDVSFSGQDLEMIAHYPGLARVYAHGHQGSVYAVDGAKKGVSQKMKSASTNVYNLVGNAKEFPYEVKSRVHQHAILSGMQEAGEVTGYQASLAPDVQKVIDDHPETFKKAVNLAMVAARRHGSVK